LSGPELLVDLSELVDRRFVCLEDCQLCCLCQPELLESEIPSFKKNFPQLLVTRRSPHQHTAIALKKGSGPCAFLDERRCAIYPNRPHYCRQFPFHVHLSTRVQVELDLSCRGVWSGEGEDATPLAMQLIEDNRLAVRKALEQSKEVYGQFHRNCREAGIECYADDLRREFVGQLEHMADPAFLGWMLERSMEDEELDLNNGRTDLAQTDELKEELRKAAMEMALESLSSQDPLSAPVYCDARGMWNIFMSVDGELDMYVMQESGEMERTRGINPNKVPLMAPVGLGKKLFQDYMRILNGRDSLLGHAYYLLDDYGYDDPFPNVYYGVLSAAALDLLWRASLLSYIHGGELDEKGVREGIIFYDMDRLDAPTIGAFI